jgi:hypothetical protein
MSPLDINTSPMDTLKRTGANGRKTNTGISMGGKSGMAKNGNTKRGRATTKAKEKENTRIRPREKISFARNYQMNSPAATPGIEDFQLKE